MEKSCRKCAPKTSPRFLFLILLYNLKQPLRARNSFKGKIRTQSLLIDKVIKNKRGLELVNSRSSGYEKSWEKFLYILSDQVWWRNVKLFLSYSKITFANLFKPIHDIINYSTSICPFEPGKCGKERK